MYFFLTKFIDPAKVMPKRTYNLEGEVEQNQYKCFPLIICLMFDLLLCRSGQSSVDFQFHYTLSSQSPLLHNHTLLHLKAKQDIVHLKKKKEKKIKT